MGDVTMLNISQVAPMLKEGKISPVELLDMCMKRIKALNGEYNAYVHLMEEEAYASAKQAEADIKAGKYRGPLHGVPVALKDLFYTKGVPTTGGSELMKDFIPEFNGTVVQRLIDAGVVVTGKTNTHEWAFGPTTEESCFGPSRNPWNPKKITGGSSGGSGIAAATGMAFVAMGSDTGGSIRIPAAFCGVVGFKPSYGLASLHGIIGLSFNLDHPGPLCRSIFDAALAMDAITGPDPLDPCPGRLSTPPTQFAKGLEGVEDLKGKTIGVPTNFFFDKTDREIEKLVLAAIENMKALGATIRHIEIPGLEMVPDASTVLMFAEAAHAHRERFPKHADKYQPGVRQRLEQGNKYAAVEYINALKQREQIIAAWEKTLLEVDAVVAPTCPIPAYDIGLWEIEARGKVEQARPMCTYHTRLANVTGSPAASVPCGLTSAGLPAGLMVMGRRGDDLGVMRISFAYEKHNPYPQFEAR
jgi:aspartyl-tRNA(Asn)/glutamyl-tRNA(Gln) amidotransferase subunit A